MTEPECSFIQGSGANNPIKYQRTTLSMDDVPELKPRPIDLDSVQDQQKQLETAFATVLDNIGEDKTRQGLLKTPARAAKAMLFFTKGYEETIGGKCNILIFNLANIDIVAQRDDRVKLLVCCC